MATETVLQEFEAGALTAIATAITANPGLIEGGISTVETDIETGLTNLAKNLPTVSGIAALVVGPLEAAAMAELETYVKSFIAAHTPAEVEALLVAWIQLLAKDAA